MASSWRLLEGLEKTSARMASRSMAPSGLIRVSPNSAKMAGMALPPGCVKDLEMASASMTAAPARAKMLATVLLPLPMPPVRPSRSGLRLNGSSSHRNA